MAGSKTLDLTIRIAGKMDRSLTATINGAQNSVERLARTVSRIGTAGLATMAATAVATVKAFDSCVNAAVQFEDQMANVVKYVDGLADANGRITDEVWTGGGPDANTYAENYALMTKGIMDLSTQIPYTQEELMKLAAAAGQSGKSMSDLFNDLGGGDVSGFLRDVAMVGTAWDIAAETAGDYGAKWEVMLNITHDKFMDLADVINYLGAHNATTAAEIANVVNTTASLGQVAGMSAEDTAALSTALLAMGVNQERAATSINRMYVNLNKGSASTKAQVELYKQLGLTAEGVAKSMQSDASGTILDVFKRIKDLAPEKQVAALSTLFGQWAIVGAAKVAENPAVFTQALEAAHDSDLYTGSMLREFNIKSGTAESLSQMMKSAMQAVKVDFGQTFLPAQKQIDIAIIDFLNRLRGSDALGRVAEQLATIFGNGIEWAADTLEQAMPKIETALDYLLNHGPEVVSVLKGMAATFAAMTFTPQITGLLGGAGRLLFGAPQGGGGGFLPGLLGGPGAAGAARGAAAARTATGTARRGGLVGMIGGLFRGGQRLVNQTATGASTALTYTRESAAAAAAAGKPAWKGGAAGLFGAVTNMPALLAGARRAGRARKNIDNIVQSVMENGLGGAIARGTGKTGPGRYLGRVGASLGGLGGAIGTAAGNLGKTTIVSKIAGSAPVQAIRNTAAGAAGNVVGFLGSVPGKVTGGLARMGGAIVNSAPAQAVGRAGGAVLHSAPVQFLGRAGGAAAQFAGTALSGGLGVAGAGLRTAGTVLSPLLGGLASVVSGAAPVVLAISGIIAVLSLLWGNVDKLRGPIKQVFGPEGLAVFDNFKGKVETVIGFVQGLFDGGLADTLSGVKRKFGATLNSGKGGLLTTIFGGTRSGLGEKAFDGVVSILQSILTFAGQVVNFANTQVKPVLVGIFSFITGTMLPTIISLFATAAPTISSIISGVGNIVMMVVQGIITAIQALWPFIQKTVMTVLDIAGVVIPALLNAINLILPVIQDVIGLAIPAITVAVSAVGGLLSGLAVSIAEIIAGITRTFNGIIEFIQGVFTLNWKKAWNGIKDIFGGAFQALVGLCKTPMNAVIGIINGAINGINKISFTIPEWSPIMPGKTFGGFHIPLLPLLARGGFTSGPSIAGEAGREAVISFQPGVREKNIQTWVQAGKLLGVSPNQAAVSGRENAGIMRAAPTAIRHSPVEARPGTILRLTPEARQENVRTWIQAGRGDTQTVTNIRNASNASNVSTAVTYADNRTGPASTSYVSLPEMAAVNASVTNGPKVSSANYYQSRAFTGGSNVSANYGGSTSYVSLPEMAASPANVSAVTNASKVFSANYYRGGGYTGGTSYGGNTSLSETVNAQKVSTVNHAPRFTAANYYRDGGSTLSTSYGGNSAVTSYTHLAELAGTLPGISAASNRGNAGIFQTVREVRRENLATWPRSGSLPEVLNPIRGGGSSAPVRELREIPADKGGAGINITFAPNITINGNAKKEEVDKALTEAEERFQTWIEENFQKLYERMERERRRSVYV